MNEFIYWLSIIQIFLAGFYFGSIYGCKKNEK